MNTLTTSFIRRLRERDEGAWFELWAVFGPVLRAQLSKWGKGLLGLRIIGGDTVTTAVTRAAHGASHHVAEGMQGLGKLHSVDTFHPSIRRAKSRIRALIARSEVAEDPRHAENTLKWLLRTEPSADEALQIAALGLGFPQET